MQVCTHQYRDGRWDRPFDPAMDGPATLVLAFADSRCLDDPAALLELRRAFPRSVLLGCSTAGEVLENRIEDGTVAVAVARFGSTQVRRAEAALPAAERSFEAGAALADRLLAPDLRAVFVLSTGVRVNGSELVRGINARVGSGIVVTGGLAGDGDRFRRTWVIGSDGPVEGMVTAVGFYGDRVRVRPGSRGGWEIFGPERRVTRAQGNVLYELDGKPALELYKQYLGELAAGLPATALRFPLALRERPGAEKHLVRTVLGIDEAEQSMTFAGDLPQGWLAQLMRAGVDRLVSGAEEAAAMTGPAAADAEGDTLAIAISCVGRRMVLGEAAEEEVEATLDVLPAGTRQIGFYSYGEIAPHFTGACDLHNQTMTMTVIREA